MNATQEFWGTKPRRIGPALAVAALAVTGALLLPSTLTSPAAVLSPISVPSIAAPPTELAATAGNVGKLATGVVLINTTMSSGSAAGTGMVLTADGQVLTNYHVVADSTDIEVTIASTGRTYRASVVGHDASKDVALLQIPDVSGLATVTLDDDQESSGAVTAVGNASGQGFLTESAGEIVDTSSTITVADETANSGRTMSNLIETTAQAVPGDSGGPMYDGEGEVVGITTAGTTQTASRGGRSSSQGVTSASYAVSIDSAMGVVDQIRTGVESGTVQVGPNAYLGVVVGEQGSLVQVVAGSAADNAGLVAGDVITAIGEHQVIALDDIAAALATLNPGDQVQIRWTSADGENHQAMVSLGQSPVN